MVLQVSSERDAQKSELDQLDVEGSTFNFLLEDAENVRCYTQITTIFKTFLTL